MNIYVGNLAYVVTDEELREAFTEFGSVEKVNIIMDRETGRSKGFGFVEMTDDDAALRAIQDLDQKELGGRAIRVNEARPREDRPAFS